MSKKIRQIHRWLGLIFSLSILMSAGSGVLHNIMSRTQPPPPPVRPSGGGVNVSQIGISFAEAVARVRESIQKKDSNSPLGGEVVTGVNIRSIERQVWYQVFLKGVSVPYYVNAVSGEVDSNADERYAIQIARDYLGVQEVIKTDYLTSFNSEYVNIFRILPVYRFDVRDERGTRVYISTVTGSVTRDTNNQKQFEANVFSNFHKLMFIHNKDLRDLVLTFTTAGIFILSIVGLVLFVLTRPRNL